jgi:hypothetical protein
MPKTSEEKPIVKFEGEPEFFDYYGGNKHPVARLQAVDHPVLRTGQLRTSLIIKRNEDGSFETRNTHYVPG